MLGFEAGNILQLQTNYVLADAVPMNSHVLGVGLDFDRGQCLALSTY